MLIIRGKKMQITAKYDNDFDSIEVEEMLENFIQLRGKLQNYYSSDFFINIDPIQNKIVLTSSEKISLDDYHLSLNYQD